jgi:beta-lactamase regulating signal transducer with metallopeptidase domain
MTMIWAIGAALAVIVVIALALMHRRRHQSDLGTLSERWMVEQRFRSFDSHR